MWLQFADRCCSRTYEAHRNDGRLQAIDATGFRSQARSRSRSDLGRTATSCSLQRNSNASVGAALCPAEIIECPARMRHRTPPPIEVRNVQQTIRVSTVRLQRFANTACALVWDHK